MTKDNPIFHKLLEFCGPEIYPEPIIEDSVMGKLTKFLTKIF